MVSPKLATAAGKETLLMSKELEERIDMSAYRSAPPISSATCVVVTLDDKTTVEGKLVRVADGTPHPTLTNSMQVVVFIMRSSDALKLFTSGLSNGTRVTITDGNIEAPLRLHCARLPRPSVTLESIKDSDDLLVTLMAW